MKIANYLIKVDNFASYVPVLSTVASIVNLFQKAYFKAHFLLSKSEKPTFSNPYYEHINNKSTFRLLISLVPFTGNLIISVYDLKKHVSRTSHQNPKATTASRPPQAPLGAKTIAPRSDPILDARKPQTSLSQARSYEPLRKALEDETKAKGYALYMQAMAYVSARPNREEGSKVSLDEYKKAVTLLEQAKDLGYTAAIPLLDIYKAKVAKLKENKKSEETSLREQFLGNFDLSTVTTGEQYFAIGTLLYDGYYRGEDGKTEKRDPEYNDYEYARYHFEGAKTLKYQPAEGSIESFIQRCEEAKKAAKAKALADNPDAIKSFVTWV